MATVGVKGLICIIAASMLNIVPLISGLLRGCSTELDSTKDRMMEILDDRGLGFLLPLLRVQSEMCNQLKADPNPAAFYKWICDNVDGSLYADPGFITALVTT